MLGLLSFPAYFANCTDILLLSESNLQKWKCLNPKLLRLEKGKSKKRKIDK